MPLFRRRYLISLFYLMVVTAGVSAWMNISMESAPTIELPSVTVSYNWGSTSPEIMEQEVTRKVEQLAYRLRDVEKVQSITREGASTVTIEFASQAPVEFRVLELREALFSMQDALPASLSQPRINRRIPQELRETQTFIVYSVSGDRPVNELLEFTRRNIQTPLMGMAGLADIDIRGANDPVLAVVFDTEKLERLTISSTMVMSQVRDKLGWRSAGYTDLSTERYSLMVPPQFSTTADIENMRIQVPGSSRILRLGELARVRVQDYPAKSLKRINGSPAITLFFQKEAGADALSLARDIHRQIDELKATFPAGIHVRLERDGTEKLREQLSELQMQSLLSLLSVFLILLVFIRRFRAPFIILGSILFSILLSLFALFLIGYTLNILTLAGLTVALGMIIDNAVVVFEQANPGLPSGREARLEHIRRQLPRAIVPVIGSTLTTVGIFIPLMFAMEELRVFLAPLAVALTFTLLASVLISLTWIPYALVWLVPKSQSEALMSRKGKPPVSRFIRGLIPTSLRFFYWRHRMRWLVYPALIAAIGIPLFAIPEPDREQDSLWQKITSPYFENRNNIDPWVGGVTYRFFKETYFGSPWRRTFGESITVSIRTPQGTPIDEIDKIARNFETIAAPYSESLIYFETDVSEYSGARIVFHIKDDYLMRPEPYILYAEAAYLAARTGNTGISVSGLGDSFGTGFMGSSSNFSISLFGYSYDELYDMAADLQRRLETNRRVDNVDINRTGFFSRGDLYQYKLSFDPDMLASKGLNRSQLIAALQLDINPENTFGRIEFNDQTMYLMGISDGASSYWDDFRQLKRRSGGMMFNVEEVATLGKERVMSDIRREDQSYQRVVGFDFRGPYRMGSGFVEQVLETFPRPIGTRVQFGTGWSFGRTEQTRNLLFVLALALFSVWMIVSALLEKWRDPLVVILAVPLSLLGVMSGVLWHNINFDQGAIAGTLLAVGVVVNNSILLMHEKDRQRQLGIFGFRSWRNVYKSKMRPVLITTLTTIGGLIPLILLGSSEFWSDLAIVVTWGLGFSTVLILLLIGIWERDGVATSRDNSGSSHPSGKH
ncbi:MAG: efflux RND transporter permease subunit [Balneolaceae bacterium]|nr:MAG: efflux RND transporter permease subunit [Balneolaceae bacterium]